MRNVAHVANHSSQSRTDRARLFASFATWRVVYDLGKMKSMSTFSSFQDAPCSVVYLLFLMVFGAFPFEILLKDCVSCLEGDLAPLG